MRAFVPFLNTSFMEGVGAIQLLCLFVYFIETDYTDHGFVCMNNKSINQISIVKHFVAHVGNW